MPRVQIDDSNENFDSLPEELRELLETVGFAVPDTWAGPQVQEFYERNIIHGRCVLCTSKLEDETVLVMNEEGVQVLFCGMACWQDMHLMHWLQEAYDDLTDSVKVRAMGGEHGEAALEEGETSEEGEEAQEEGGEEAGPAGDPTDPREDEPEGEDPTA